MRSLFRQYYKIRGLLPRTLQIHLRRCLARHIRWRTKSIWPIPSIRPRSPAGFPGWPGGKRFALVLRHDVETSFGVRNVPRVVEMDRSFGLTSAFYFVPERYPLDSEIRRFVAAQGFEVGVHGLRHDGRLYSSWSVFQARARRINAYIRNWSARGFVSPSAHHQLEWLHRLNIEYDSSTFDTDPFEPQPDSLGTVYPAFVAGTGGAKGYVELPYTIPQDFTLFVILRERSISIWKQKVDWIAQQGGMVLVNTHPDYMWFRASEHREYTYPHTRYADLLRYIRRNYDGEFWHALPSEVAAFWRENVRPDAEPTPCARGAASSVPAALWKRRSR